VARLTTVAQSQRDLGNSIVPAIFRGDAEPDAGEPVYFSESRGSGPALSVLELLPVDGALAYQMITPNSPLRVCTNLPIGADEEILAFGFDGIFYLPLGRATREGDATIFRLDRLPHPVAAGERDLTGSVKILFQKLVATKLGRPFPYPILGVAEPDGAGGVTYERRLDVVRRRVEAAERIVLCIHGIIGDTRGIAAAVIAAQSDALVLTFDYENLDTSIEENAALLKQRLEEAGLGTGHKKSLQIVAHSMGGLVARWFVEQLGGNEVVRHVVMLGTPNDGSPWPTVEGFLTGTVALVLNGLTGLSWPVRALGWLLRAAPKVDRSLSEMRTASGFLTRLCGSADPGTAYDMLAGNTDLIRTAQSPRERRVLALIRSAAVGELLHRVLSAAVFGQPNDIAVSVASCTAVAASRRPTPVAHVTPCDHLTYFSTPEAVQLMWDTLGLTSKETAAQLAATQHN
jgi:pimeloyl-ACP methyl ester carboxylesterase